MQGSDGDHVSEVQGPAPEPGNSEPPAAAEDLGRAGSGNPVPAPIPFVVGGGHRGRRRGRRRGVVGDLGTTAGARGSDARRAAAR